MTRSEKQSTSGGWADRIRKSTKRERIIGGLGAATGVGVVGVGGRLYYNHYHGWHLRHYKIKDSVTRICLLHHSKEKMKVVAIYFNGFPVLDAERYTTIREKFVDLCENSKDALEKLDSKSEFELQEIKVLESMRKTGDWGKARNVAIDQEIRPINKARPTSFSL